ncbi:MAG TPA: hypothetical protein VLB44_23405, partial [Kofleriaceae bacterium]|nr:hypothetical protein [Kofleriaceae bacterium]
MRLSLCLAVLGGLAGCQRSPDEAKASATQAAGSAKAAVVAGTERGDCRPDHTCDTGLLCLSDLCVRPPAADCAAVAEIIASFELGNYAPRDKRDAMLGQKKAMCEAQRLSKDDQKCIVDAKDKWAIVKCAPAMYPELASTNQGSGATDCEAVVATLTRIIQTQMSATGGGQDPMTQKMIGLATQAVRSSCL